MKNNTEPATPEITSQLVREINLFTDALSNNADFLNSLIINLETELHNNVFKDLKDDVKRFIELNEFYLLISLNLLDFYSVFRLYLTTGIRYDQIFALKQLLIITNESYKKVYGFGDSINTSFWKKNIKSCVETYAINMESKYNELTEELSRCIKNNFEGKELLDKRNFAVHYDEKPTKVYLMLVNLDWEKLIRQIDPYLSLLHKTITFYNKLIIEIADDFAKKTSTSLSKSKDDFDELIKKYKENSKAMKIIGVGRNNLLSIEREYYNKRKS